MLCCDTDPPGGSPHSCRLSSHLIKFLFVFFFAFFVSFRLRLIFSLFFFIFRLSLSHFFGEVLPNADTAHGVQIFRHYSFATLTGGTARENKSRSVGTRDVVHA